MVDCRFSVGSRFRFLFWLCVSVYFMNTISNLMDEMAKQMERDIMRPSIFVNLNSLCKQYSELSPRHWKKKRELRRAIASRAIEEYMWREYEAND